MEYNIKQCIYCGKTYKNFNPKYKFCPKCGGKLKTEEEIILMEKYERELSLSRTICQKCDKEFDENYIFCPLCGTELKKERIFNFIDDNGYFEAKWNNSTLKIHYTEFDVPLTDPYQVPSPLDAFRSKRMFDEKLEEDLILFEQPSHRKLTYKQVMKSLDAIGNASVCGRNEHHFIIMDSDELKKRFHVDEEYIFINAKIGKNLYLIFDTEENIKSKLKEF